MGLKDELGGRGHEMGPEAWVQRVRLGGAVCSLWSGFLRGSGGAPGSLLPPVWPQVCCAGSTDFSVLLGDACWWPGPPRGVGLSP